MAGRRRKWLIAAALLAIVAVLVWASLGRGGKMEVQLRFIGYTNYTATFTNAAFGSLIFTGNVFSAIVFATNSGNWAVELHPMVQPSTFFSWRNNMAVAIGTKPAIVLKPGETSLIEVVPQTLGVPWYTEMLTQRRGLGDRMYVKSMAKGGATVQGMLRNYFSPPPEVWARLGPITNAPLDKESVRYLIEPRLRGRPADDLFEDEN